MEMHAPVIAASGVGRQERATHIRHIVDFNHAAQSR